MTEVVIDDVVVTVAPPKEIKGRKHRPHTLYVPLSKEEETMLVELMDAKQLSRSNIARRLIADELDRLKAQNNVAAAE